MAAAAKAVAKPEATRLLADLTEAIAAGKSFPTSKRISAHENGAHHRAGAFHWHWRHRMSGIAEVLHNLGFKVQGSDQSDSANCQRLRDKGIECFVGHTAANLGAADVVVVSTAIKKNNPELVAARESCFRGAPRRNAGRTDALSRSGGHWRQLMANHDNVDGGGASGCGRARPDSHQRRYHQRLWHQCAHGWRRLDGGEPTKATAHS